MEEMVDNDVDLDSGNDDRDGGDDEEEHRVQNLFVTL